MRIANALSSAIERRNFVDSTFERYILCPLAVAAALLLLEASVRIGWPIVLAFPYMVLAITTMLGGLRSAIAAATLILAYVIYQGDHYGLNGGLQVIVCAYGIAGAVGTLKYRERAKTIEAERNRHAAEAMNAVNGNLGKLKELHLDSVKLVDGWPSLSDAAKFEVVNGIRGGLAHVLNIWEGWHALFQEREILKWDKLKQTLEGGNRG